MDTIGFAPARIDGLLSIAAATEWVAISQDDSQERRWPLVAWGLLEHERFGRHVIGLVYPSPGDGVINAEELPGFSRYEHESGST
jgi:hypothetical protein